MASNPDGGLEYESDMAAGTGSGPVAERSLATRRAPWVHIGRTTLVTDCGRTAQ